MDKAIKLLLEDIETSTRPSGIVRMLQANKDVVYVTFVDCSAVDLLEFMLEVQRIAVDAHVASANN